MAESKRADALDLGITVPPFDAPGYVAKEEQITRATITTAALGALLGALSSVLSFALGTPWVGLLFLLLGWGVMRKLLDEVGVAMEDWDRKAWLGQALFVLFSWLAVWIVLLNAPFSS